MNLQKFAIIGKARSGTTSLTEFLDQVYSHITGINENRTIQEPYTEQSGDLARINELVGKDTWDLRDPKKIQNSLQRIYEEMDFWGTKHTFDSLYDEQIKGLLEYCTANNIKVLHIIRSDKPRGVLSAHMALHHKIWHVRNEGDRNNVDEVQEFPSFPLERLQNTVFRGDGYDEYLRKLFDKKSITSMEISFNELFRSDNSLAMAKLIVRSMGITQDDISAEDLTNLINASNVFRSETHQHHQEHFERIQNWDELKAFVEIYD